jgi:predicted DNA-binding transcriptional regulator AlpA
MSHARHEHAAAPTANHPAQPTPDGIQPYLLTERQAAAFLQVGERTFAELRKEKWMPRPIQLGPRLLRFSREELIRAIAEMPRYEGRDEPSQLREARVVRVKAGVRQ